MTSAAYFSACPALIPAARALLAIAPGEIKSSNTHTAGVRNTEINIVTAAFWQRLAHAFHTNTRKISAVDFNLAAVATCR